MTTATRHGTEGKTIHLRQTEIVKPGEEEVSPVQLLLDLEAAGAVTPTALILTDATLPFERWVSLGRYFGAIRRSSAFWIGDWINFGEGVYGEKYAQAMAVTGLDRDTLINYAYVCRNVPKGRRREELSFSAHAEVAPLPPDAQAEWLQRAAENGLSRSELRLAIKQAGEAPPEREQPDRSDREERVAREVQLEWAARQVWKTAQREGDRYVVPAEAMSQLAAALGEE